MPFDGWMSYGGNEIVNNERARGYSRTAECPMAWLTGLGCNTLSDALGDGPEYSYAAISDAPWYDLSLPDLSSRFFGVFGLGVTGLNSSTRGASVTEGTADGGSVGRTRKATRSVRYRVLLLARGADALDYGVAWLSAALEPGACGQHGDSCGSADMEFFTECPPARPSVGGVPATDPVYAALVDKQRRFIHDTTVTSGPLESTPYESNGFFAQEFEFTITSGRPWVYSTTRPVSLPVTPTIVIQDSPYNLVPYPSAEIAAAGSVEVGRNLSANPSVETNATGWSGDSIGMTAATGGRSTELAAVGAASFRSQVVAGSAGSGGQVRVSHTVAVAPAARQRLSVGMWASGLLVSGTATLGLITLYALFYNGGTLLSTVTVGTQPAAGGALSAKSLTPPAGTTTVVLIASLAVASWASGATINLYGDAAAVTAP